MLQRTPPSASVARQYDMLLLAKFIAYFHEQFAEVVLASCVHTLQGRWTEQRTPSEWGVLLPGSISSV